MSSKIPLGTLRATTLWPLPGTRALHWTHHLLTAGQFASPELLKTAADLCSHSSPNYKTWFQRLLKGRRPPSPHWPTFPTPLIVASFVGLLPVVDWLLQNTPAVDLEYIEDRVTWTAAECAAWYGHGATNCDLAATLGERKRQSDIIETLTGARSARNRI